jgi:hypothetical protein
MKNSWRRTLTTLGFTTLIAATVPACVFTARARVRPAVVVYEEPPAPRDEVVRTKAGHLWVQGRWEWQHSRWVWKNGYWVRARANYGWEGGRWEKRGNQWHWVDGRWVPGGGGGVDVRDHRDHRDNTVGTLDTVVTLDVNLEWPNMAPPEPQVEPNPAPKRGYVWVRGNWDWQRGNGWKWTAGHWERQKSRMTWTEGYWEVSGDHWIWVSGGWN